MSSDAGPLPYDPATFAPGHRPPPGLVVLVGGVAELYQTDLDLGRHVVERVQQDEHRAGVYVEDLSYGAIPFTHRLMELEPDVLVLVGAVRRDREPGSVHRHVVTAVERSEAELQGAVGDAYVGYVDLDLAVEVAHAFGLLPGRTVLVEVEPATTGPGDQMTPAVAAAVGPAAVAVRREVSFAPLFDLHARVRDRPGELGPSPVTEALAELCAALDVAAVTADRDEEDRHWGLAHAAAGRLRHAVGSAAPGEGTERSDWGVLWGLVEELGRLRPLTLAPHG